MGVIVDRCAGLDVHKRTVVACVRTPGTGRRKRDSEVRTFDTFTDGLIELREWLIASKVSEVAMEATGVFWKPVWDVLEGHGFEVLLECGLLRGSFVPPGEIRQLREITRYRRQLVEERSREVLRLQKLLEDAGVKLSSVASDTLGVTGRAMLEALIDGERDPAVLAGLAKGRLKVKSELLARSVPGRFNSFHAVMARELLDHIDYLDLAVSRLDDQVDVLMVPFVDARDRLDTIPGIAKRCAEIVIAEIGVDMTRFPTPGHLASWAGLCPGDNESAGKHRSTTTRSGNQWLTSALVEAA